MDTQTSNNISTVGGLGALMPSSGMVTLPSIPNPTPPPPKQVAVVTPALAKQDLAAKQQTSDAVGSAVQQQTQKSLSQSSTLDQLKQQLLQGQQQLTQLQKNQSNGGQNTQTTQPTDKSQTGTTTTPAPGTTQVTLPNGAKANYNPTTSTLTTEDGKPLTYTNGQWVDPSTGQPPQPTGTQTPTGGTQGQTTTTAQSGIPSSGDPFTDYVIGQMQQNQQQLDTTSAQHQQMISSLLNGTFPLTADQQAQVAGLQSQLAQLKTQQQTANDTYLNSIKRLGVLSGQSQYEPGAFNKVISDTLTSGIQKISNLDIQAASQVATLKEGFLNDDYTKINGAYKDLQDSITAKNDTLTKMQSIVSTQVKNAQDEADKAQQYNLDVAKFNQTGDQDAFDNALKTEQEKVAESAQAETARHDKATEAISAYSAGLGAGGGTPGGVTQSAQLTPSGNADPATQKAVLDQITAKYGPMTAQAIQGLANYTINPADWSSRAGTKGLSRADAVSLAQMYDPTYSDTNYAIRASYLKSISSTQSGTVGSSVNAANKSVNHLTAFVNSMQQLNNGPLSGANAINNAFLATNQAKQQALSAAQTEGLGVAEELAKFFKGSGTVDVASIDAWKSQLNTNASPAAVKGLTQGAITLLAGQLETLTEQYQATMGKAPETDFLNTSARASLSNLKNQGYEVNIPGINYTDKDAYIKNDPSAQQNMNAAVTALTNAGLPVTPENILQAAQSI